MKVILGTFKDDAQELADFLGPRLGDVPAVSGGEITFDDDKMKKNIRARHVKTYIKRYLNRKGERENYQILVEGRELRMIELEREEEEEEEKENKKRAQKAEKKEEEEEETEKAPELTAPESEKDSEEEEETPKSKKSSAAASEEDASDSTSS